MYHFKDDPVKKSTNKYLKDLRRDAHFLTPTAKKDGWQLFLLLLVTKPHI